MRLKSPNLLKPSGLPLPRFGAGGGSGELVGDVHHDNAQLSRIINVAVKRQLEPVQTDLKLVIKQVCKSGDLIIS